MAVENEVVSIEILETDVRGRVIDDRSELEIFLAFSRGCCIGRDRAGYAFRDAPQEQTRRLIEGKRAVTNQRYVALRDHVLVAGSLYAGLVNEVLGNPGKARRSVEVAPFVPIHVGEVERPAEGVGDRVATGGDRTGLAVPTNEWHDLRAIAAQAGDLDETALRSEREGLGRRLEERRVMAGGLCEHQQR